MLLRRIFLSLAFTGSSFLSISQTPTLQWVKSTGNVGGDVSNGLALDASNNVHITGVFSGTVDFDPGPGTVTLTSPTSDVFVSKSDASGVLIWAKQLSGLGVSTSNAITVDATGNVYITGYFSSTMDFDPGPATFNMTATGGYDIFVLKLNSSGGFVWAQKMGGSSFDIPYAITVDAAGNVYTTGTFQGAGDYNPGPGTYVLTPSGSADAFVSKLNSSGTFVWAKQFEASNTAVGNAIKTDASGNVFVSGFFSGAGDFDTGPGTFPFISAGSTDIYVAKLDVNGAMVWAKQMGGVNGDYTQSIVLDATGSVFMTGRFQGTVDFDPGAPVYNLVSDNGSTDIFVCKLNPSGTFAWAGAMGGPGDDIGNSIVLDAGGNVYSTGYYSGTGDLDPGAGTYTLTSSGSYDIYISKLTPAGSFIWAQNLGGTNADVGSGLAVDPTENVYTTGYFGDTPDFDPGVGTFTLTSAGGNDIFTHKMCILPPPPVNATPPTNTAACNGESATLTVNSPSGTVNWYSSPTGTTVIGTGTNYITSPLTIGTYTYYAEAVGCFANPVRTAISVTVSPLPVYSASTNSIVICNGQTANLTITGVTSATWIPGPFTGTTVVVSPTISTGFTVVGYNAGCTVTTAITQLVSNCTNSTGIQQNSASAPLVNIYPNPFNNKFTIVTNADKESQLKVYNMLGTLIYSDILPVAKTGTEISLADQPKGIYFVKIDHNGSSRTLKIVKE